MSAIRPANPLFFQAFILQCFGFHPLFPLKRQISHRWSRILQGILTTVGMTFILGSLACAALQMAVSLWHMIYPAGGDSMLLVNMFALLSYVTFIIRAAVVLTIIFWKRNSWIDLYYSVQIFLNEAFPIEHIRNKLLKKWRMWSWLLFLITVICHIGWDVIYWYERLRHSPEMSLTSKMEAPEDFAIDIITWKFIVFWELFACISFILSQQVLILVVILAMIVADSLGALNHEIQRETAILEGKDERGVKDTAAKISDKISKGLSVAAEMETKIRMWKKRHIDTVRLCEQLNRYFGLPMFIIYGLDFITVLAFGANILVNNRGTVDSYAYYIYSFVLFASYGTFFLIPLIFCHEKSVAISYHLHELSNVMEFGMESWTNTANKLVSSLLTFETATRHHLCLINGCEILHFTRRFVLGTCTVIFSLLIVAKELIDRDIEQHRNMETMMHHMVNEMNKTMH